MSESVHESAARTREVERICAGGTWPVVDGLTARRRELEAYLGYKPTGSCIAAGCTVVNDTDLGDADAYFCSEHCPVCRGAEGE